MWWYCPVFYLAVIISFIVFVMKIELKWLQQLQVHVYVMFSDLASIILVLNGMICNVPKILIYLQCCLLPPCCCRSIYNRLAHPGCFDFRDILHSRVYPFLAMWKILYLNLLDFIEGYESYRSTWPGFDGFSATAQNVRVALDLEVIYRCFWWVLDLSDVSLWVQFLPQII